MNRFTLPESKNNASPDIQKQSDFSEIEMEKKRLEENSFWHGRTGKIWMAIFSVCILLSSVAGVFIYRNGSATESEVNSKTITPNSSSEIKLTPFPTAEIPVDVSKYTISVLNGSGVPGEAARVQKLLEEQQFNVSTIGNADRLTYEKTVIQAKESVPEEYLQELVKLLDELYSLEEPSKLSEESEYVKTDIVVIIGSTKE